MSADPLSTLRAYRELAPWNLRDLTDLASAILESGGVRPTNPSAAVAPSERTVRFYVARGIVAGPDGSGTAATYNYRHLLQVLAVKLRQMEGATLGDIGGELRALSGDVLERRVASTLGPALPPPNRLPILDAAPAGRTGRALRVRGNGGETRSTPSETAAWHRLPVAPGVELHLRADHLLAGDTRRAADVAEAVRLTLGRLVSHQPPAD